MSHVGYIRVSTTVQNTDRQLEGVALDKTFEDKLSGKDIQRPQLQACREWVREGDTVHVHSIDRLARNLADLEALVKAFNARGAAVQFHKERLQFTGKDDALQTLMFQMMGAFAQFERALIRERQREGIAAAKAKGKKLGRSPKLSPEQVQELRARVSSSARKSALAKEYGISRQTLYTLIDGV